MPMKKYEVKLQAEMSTSFRAVRAANSLDIDVEKKSMHEFSVVADLDAPFNVGAIVGASGSGKSTLARAIFGDGCFRTFLDPRKAVIDQFPDEMSYDDVAATLNGIGLTAVPCWIKPAGTLSNGQQARAEAALAMVKGGDRVIIDEWTSVVDRQVAKAMSHCVQKYARRSGKRVVLVACHYDILEWLDPDWVIDCNAQKFLDRRLLQPEERRRKDQLHFDVREVSSRTWAAFSKYHYLSSRAPGGESYYYGLFQGDDQIGFQAFSNLLPITRFSRPVYHSNRVVVHPDYAGLGLGLRMVNACCELMRKRIPGCELRATFSSEPMYRARKKDTENWALMRVARPLKEPTIVGAMGRKKGFRTNVKLYTFRYIGGRG